MTQETFPPANSSGLRSVRAEQFALEQRLRTFGAQFDALIRAQRSGLARVAPLSEALLSASKAMGLPHFELSPRGLHAGNVLVLEATGESGRWLLGAFMAGVRRVRLGPGATAPQVEAFCLRLGELKIENQAVQDFHDWLWADGGEGIEVELSASFIESVETASVAALSATVALALRAGGASQGDGESVTIDSRELDAAAARAEFEVPLAALAEAIAGRRLEVQGPEFLRVRERVEAPGVWAEAEIDVVLAHPALRSAMPPARLVKVLQARFASGCDARMVQLITRIFTTPDSFTDEVTEGLLRAGAGLVIASGLRADEATMPALLLAMLRAAPLDLRLGVMPTLLTRAATEPSVEVLVGRLMGEATPVKFLDFIRPTDLTQLGAGALVSALADCGATTHQLGALIGRLEPVVAAQTLAAQPLSRWSALGAQVAHLIALGHPATTTPLLERALREPGAKLEPLIAPLRATRSHGVLEAQLKPLVVRLLAERQGALLVQYALDRTLGVERRLTVLEVLARDAGLTRQVSAWRLREWFEPAPVRARLSLMRRLSTVAKTEPKRTGHR